MGVTDAAGAVISAMTPEDYDEVHALWRVSSEGVRLNDRDTQQGIAEFIARNPGLSLVARGPDGKLVGAVLCGHDGRRGYLHHLAVDPRRRRGGLGRALVEVALDRLAAIGITQTYCFVVDSNPGGLAFWAAAGWRRRDVVVMHVEPEDRPAAKGRGDA